MTEGEALQWSPEEIARSLDLQTYLPGCREKIARLSELSTEAAALLNIGKMAYGASTAEYILTVTHAGGHARTPLVAFLHGGYWRALHAEDVLFIAPSVLSAGLDFASINYRLCPQVSFEQLVSEVLAAIAALARQHPERPIWLAGHSAGAHLAMLACGSDWWRAAGLTTHPVKRALLISGLYDLSPVQQSFLQPTLKLTANAVQQLSPLFAPANPQVDYSLVYGALETEIFKVQSLQMHRKLKHAGATSRVHAIPGADHFDVLLNYFGAHARESWLGPPQSAEVRS